MTLTLLSVTSPAVTTQSGADGRFEFLQLPDVDLGVYRVLAASTGTGFTPAFHDLQLSSASQHITNLDFVANGASIVSFGLTPAGTFRLRLMGTGQAYRIEGAGRYKRVEHARHRCHRRRRLAGLRGPRSRHRSRALLPRRLAGSRRHLARPPPPRFVFTRIHSRLRG